MSSVLKNSRLVENEQIKSYFSQIHLILQHIHSLGIIHRDIKFENFIIDENDQLTLVDFGSSIMIEENSEKVIYQEY